MIIYAVDTKTKATVQLWFILTTTHTNTLISHFTMTASFPITFNWPIYSDITHEGKYVLSNISCLFPFRSYFRVLILLKACSGIKSDESGRNRHTRREDGHTFHWNDSRLLSSCNDKWKPVSRLLKWPNTSFASLSFYMYISLNDCLCVSTSVWTKLAKTSWMLKHFIFSAT